MKDECSPHSSIDDLREGMTQYWKNHSKRVNVQEMMLDENAELISEEESTEILSMLPDWKGKTVVELGAGIGRFTGQLSKRADHVTAVDFMEPFLNQNKETHSHCSNIDFVCADVTKMELPPKSVDIVFSNWLFMYLSDKETLTVFKNILNWLKDDGFFFFRESCFHQSGNMQRDMNPTKYRDPTRYAQILYQSIESADDNATRKRHFDILFARPVQTYIRYKQNSNQMCWLVRVNTITRATSEQELLDNFLYRLPQISLVDNLMSDEKLYQQKLSKQEEQFYEEVHFQDEDFVLDMGCGAGIHAFLLAKIYNVRVLGVDLSSNQITLAMKRNNRIKDGRVCFEISNLNHLFYPASLADVIHCRNTLHHFKNKRSILSNLFEILKPHGRMIIFDLTVKMTTTNQNAVSALLLKPIYAERDAQFFSTVEELTEDLRSAGFQKIHCLDATEYGSSLVKTQLDDLISAKQTLLREHSEHIFNEELKRRELFCELFENREANGLQWSVFYAVK